MNHQPIIPSMFLHRLKNEFTENIKLVLAFWIVLGIIVWSFYQWWFGTVAEASESQQTIGGFAVLGAGLVALFLVATLFKRDDLKHPQEFWVTRPIRSFTLFGAKLVFSWLVVALPCGVSMTLIGLIADVGFPAIWNGLETMMWMGFATNLLALSCMAHPGNRALLGFFGFVGGVIFMGIAISNAPLRGLVLSHGVSSQQSGWNLLIVLVALSAFFGFRCWRLIRNRHATQNPIILLALGVLVVPLLAFVPIPGKSPSIEFGTAAVSLPTVTEGKIDGLNFSYGTKYGAKFAAVQIELPPIEFIQGAKLEVSDTDLHVVGEDNVLQGFEAGSLKYTRGDEHPEVSLALTYSVYDRQPGSSRRSSSGGSPDSDRVMAKLPLRKARIRGTITLRSIEYREIARGSLDQAFSHHEGGIQCSFDPSASLVAGSDRNASWKTFSPPLVSSRFGKLWEAARFRIQTPEIMGVTWIDQFGGNSSGGGTFFGSYRINDLRISDNEIAADYYWQKLKEGGYTKSVKEWKKEAQLICEVVDRVTPVILPVEIEVEMPDPNKVRELLLKGDL